MEKIATTIYRHDGTSITTKSYRTNVVDNFQYAIERAEKSEVDAARESKDCKHDAKWAVAMAAVAGLSLLDPNPGLLAHINMIIGTAGGVAYGAVATLHGLKSMELRNETEQSLYDARGFYETLKKYPARLEKVGGELIGKFKGMYKRLVGTDTGLEQTIDIYGK